MKGLPAWALKGAAICLTLLATVGGANYVGGHVKNSSAPLQPPVERKDQGGQLSLGPDLPTTATPAVTDTRFS